MVARLATAALILALAGCSAFQQPEVVTVTETVEKPVTVFQPIEIPMELVEPVVLPEVAWHKCGERICLSKQDANSVMATIEILLQRHRALIEFNNRVNRGD